MTHFLLSPSADALLPRQPHLPATGAGGTGALHIVEPGQSMEEIARQHGVTEHSLRQANDLGPGQAVYPETPLRIPGQASLAPHDGELADTAAFRPEAPDDGGGSAGELTWVPDFKSMSRDAIHRYLESPEFRDMATKVRQEVQRLQRAGQDEAAARCLADALAGMPPEVAARVAGECRQELVELCRQVTGADRLFSELARAAGALAHTPEGRQLVGEMAASMVKAMTPEAMAALFRSIQSGRPEHLALKLAWLDALAGNFSSHLPPGPLANLIMRNGIPEVRRQLLQAAVQAYADARKEVEKLDREFADVLSRLDASLTNEQKLALYRKFMADPKHRAAYEAAARAGQAIDEAVSAAPAELAALARNPAGAGALRDLITSLARSGRGMAATELVLAVKNDPAALALLGRVADMRQLEALAASAALAEATAAAGGDVQAGLEQVLELLQGAVGDAKGLIGTLKKVLKVLEGGKGTGAESIKEISDLLKKAGAWANIIGGLLSMAIALTSPTKEQYDVSMQSLSKAGASTISTASDMVSILSGLVSAETTLGKRLAEADKALGFASKVLGVLSNSVEVANSIQQMVKNGAPNGGDVTSMIGALIGIAAVIPGIGEAAAVLTLASMIVLAAGDAIRNYDKEAELLKQYEGYLQEMGMDPGAARKLLSNPLTSQRLASLGFDARQIQALAKQSPWLFDVGWGEFGFLRLASALKHAGLDAGGIMALLAGLDDNGVRKLSEAIANDISLQNAFANVKDTATMAAALERVVAALPAGEAREAARTLLASLGSR